MPPEDGVLELGGFGMTPEQLSSLLLTQMANSSNVSQNNFITVNKALDYDHMENKRIVTLDEAVGVREVASKSVPAGPNVS